MLLGHDAHRTLDHAALDAKPFASGHVRLRRRQDLETQVLREAGRCERSDEGVQRALSDRACRPNARRHRIDCERVDDALGTQSGVRERRNQGVEVLGARRVETPLELAIPRERRADAHAQRAPAARLEVACDSLGEAFAVQEEQPHGAAFHLALAPVVVPSPDRKPEGIFERPSDGCGCGDGAPFRPEALPIEGMGRERNASAGRVVRDEAPVDGGTGRPLGGEVQAE